MSRTKKTSATAPTYTPAHSHGENQDGPIGDVSGFENPVFTPEEIEEHGYPKGWLSAVVRGKGASIKIKMSREDLVKLLIGWMEDTPSIEGVMIEALKRKNMRELFEFLSESNED